MIRFDREVQVEELIAAVRSASPASVGEDAPVFARLRAVIDGVERYRERRTLLLT